MSTDVAFQVPVTYDGKAADEHKIDLFALGQSLQGVARILAVTSHFVVTGEYAKHFGAHAVKVYATEPEESCFSLNTVVEFLHQHQILSGGAGALLTALVAYVISRNSNNREEMKILSARLEQAIAELGNRDKQVIDRMMSTIEKMADSLRPAVRSAVQPVGEECDTLTIGSRTNPDRTVIDRARRDAIMASDDHVLTDLREWKVVFTELDKENRTGKVRILDGDTDARVRAEISDPAFSSPGNRYLHSFEHNAEITVKAKAILKDGEVDRLYVIDAS